ncbi:hypothetical protein CesoFtcFv8_005122 [Champsocephalus esox]|uniref:Uncharacterized protein n=1 Tax=Champsocephalus esox TaxID=159716 RepID=A0AAN8CPG1_9TELE|nr:hypothetical protein CesoFtcFv8_005122 [Champsocephalus esox]
MKLNRSRGWRPDYNPKRQKERERRGAACSSTELNLRDTDSSSHTSHKHLAPVNAWVDGGQTKLQAAGC